MRRELILTRVPAAVNWFRMKPSGPRTRSSKARPPGEKGTAPEPLALDAFLPYRLSVLANTISNDLARWPVHMRETIEFGPIGVHVPRIAVSLATTPELVGEVVERMSAGSGA